MPYVETENGVVIATYARPQAGRAEVLMDEADARVVTFRAAQSQTGLTPKAFRDLFTDAELDGVLGSSDTFVRRLVAKLYTATEIRTDDPEVIAGVGHLVTLGILTTARRDEILS